MKKIPFLIAFAIIAYPVLAQNDTANRTRRVALTTSSSDHLMLQLGYAGWSGRPDSINTGGISRTFNLYFLFDFPFKTNPKFSAAIGAGIATDNIYFDEMEVGITETTPMLQFRDLSDTNHFKKYKLTTTWVEAPVELRFSSRPDQNNKSVKFAIGAKVGLLLKAHTKGKNLLNSSDEEINSFTQKLSSKRFFNTNRVSGTARIGYGHFTLFGSYSFTPLFKEGTAPEVKPFSIGLTLSGL